MGDTKPTAIPKPTVVQLLTTRLPGRAGIEYGPRPQDLTVRLHHAEDVPAAVAELRAAGLTLAMLVATDEEMTAERDLKVRYIFEPGAADAVLPDTFVTLVAALDPAQPELPSITPEVPAANWHEREAQDLFGINFVDHPDSRSLVLHDGWPKGLHPMRKSFDARQRPAFEPAEEFPHLFVEGEGVFEVPVGPIHAGIIEPGHFRFSTMGEKVLHLDPRLFYTHRGLEKRVEGLSGLEAFYVVERICGVCSVAHGLGFCEAIERIAGVETPRRARMLRTLALELERLYNHVGDIGNICAGASYHYGTSAGARMKETLQQVNERLAGNRFLRELLTPGGVRLDLDADLARMIQGAISATAEALDSLIERIEGNPSIVDRLEDIGLLPRQAAIDLGVTGVAARASGVDRDARRDHPHGAYADSDGPRVSVATAVEGDVHARLSLRATEARESMRLVRELLSGLPSGSLCAPVPERLPPWSIGLGAIESPRGAAVHWMRTDAAGRIERYHLRSPSYANWPAVALAALSAIIPDFPLVNKSFELCYSCTDR
jgi:Ni,Fe-hydrogenase III large subunit/Ni,Fe-hydrogenase III component G